MNDTQKRLQDKQQCADAMCNALTWALRELKRINEKVGDKEVAWQLPVAGITLENYQRLQLDKDVCKTCDGHGYVSPGLYEKPCPDCNGNAEDLHNNFHTSPLKEEELPTNCPECGLQQPIKPRNKTFSLFKLLREYLNAHDDQMKLIIKLRLLLVQAQDEAKIK